MILNKGRRDQTIWFSLAEDINADLRAYDPTIPNITSVLGMLKVNRSACVCISLSPLLSSLSPVWRQLFLRNKSAHSLLLFTFNHKMFSAFCSITRASCLSFAWIQTFSAFPLITLTMPVSESKKLLKPSLMRCAGS